MSRILLGVSAGVAIYKAAELASKLTQRGDEVRTLMTPHSRKFMTPLAFRALTRQPVHTDIFEEDPSSRPEHIALPEWADVFLIAPATADLIARLAAGLGSDIITVTVLACQKPIVVAPAMNDRMWANPIVQRNVGTLRETGMRILAPGEGYLACGAVGAGRLPEAAVIIAAVDEALAASSPTRAGE